MRILIDTDVLLDVALNRAAFVANSAAILRWAEAGCKAAIAWHSIANCAYLLKQEGRPFLNSLLMLVEVAPVTPVQARRALDLPMSDLEAALLPLFFGAFKLPLSELKLGDVGVADCSGEL